MENITKYSATIYKSKSSAMRAARKRVGSSSPVYARELENRFYGCITFPEAVTAIEDCEGGWRWSYTFNLADVIVEVWYEDGPTVKLWFKDVCHWPDCRTPADPLQGIGMMIAKYISRVEHVRASSSTSTPERIEFQLGCVDTVHLPAIEAACEVHGLTLNMMMARYKMCREVVKQAETGARVANWDTVYWLEMADDLGMDVSEARQALLRNANNGEAVFPSIASTLAWAQCDAAIHQQA